MKHDDRDGRGPDLIGTVLTVFCVVCGMLALAAITANLVRALGAHW